MPNHLHGVVTVDPSDEDQTSYRQTANVTLQRKPRSLGSFIVGFKATTTYHINALRGTSGASLWQRNYYERLLRNEHEMTKVWSYIDFNPWKWMQDRENPDRDQDNPIEAWLYPAPRDRR
jgi:putative transposase